MFAGINNDILKRIERMRMPDPSLVIKRLRWKEEITVEEGRKLLERTLYPFKEVYTHCTLYMHECKYCSIDTIKHKQNVILLLYSTFQASTNVSYIIGLLAFVIFTY